jgi:integrase
MSLIIPESSTPPAGLTLAEFARSHFLPHLESTIISHKEVETLLRLRILPALGHLQLCEITPQRVLTFRKQLIAEKLSASRVNAHLAALRRAFNLAIQWQLFDGRNPAAAPGMLRTEGRETFLSEPQLRALVAALQADEDRQSADAIMLLALTGARKSEILKAKWGQVDRQRKVLTVPRSKSGRRRQIFLSDEAIRILGRTPQGQAQDFIFPSARRSGQALAGLRGTWARVKAAAGTPAGVRLHDLRHTFASLLVNDGVSLYEIGKLLGHTQQSTTARYAHVRDDRQLDAVNAIARKTGPVAPPRNLFGGIERTEDAYQAAARQVLARMALRRAAESGRRTADPGANRESSIPAGGQVRAFGESPEASIFVFIPPD